MRVPVEWLREHVDVLADATAEDVAATLVRVGLEEEALHGGDVTGPLVVGRVVDYTDERQKNGKTIRWCSVDVGNVDVGNVDPGNSGVGEADPRGIVCGAHNFAVDDLVVVALPGAVLPGGFQISARRTYGHVSDGMICSAKELGLGDDHAGIIVLREYGLEAKPGDDAVGLLGLDERTVEVNVTPDRGYCLSVRGIAREYAHGARADVRTAFRDPAAVHVPDPTDDGHPVVLADDAPIHGRSGCERFVARVVRGVDPTAPSPFWMRRRLQQAGMRPISLAVDVTNYVMLLLGQPLHAYDLATLDGPVTVRRAGPGERLRTLDGVERTLDPEDLLIADGRGGARAIGMAGVMGGEETEVSAATRDVLVEAAWFDPVTVARTARRHRLGSEASRRFERGVDDDLQGVAAELAVRLLVEFGGGTPDPAATDVDQRRPRHVVRMPADEPSRLVGREYPAGRVTKLLEQVGCAVAEDGDELVVTPPSWRPDLVQGADLVEEVARLDGYDAIDSVLPVAPPGRGLTSAQRLRRSVGRALAEAGLVEVLSYPFVAPSRHDEMGLRPDDPRRRALRLANPLSDEQPELRTSLLATLVDVLRRNVSRGATDVALFEVGSVTLAGDGAGVVEAPRPGVEGRPAPDVLDALRAGVPPQPLRVAGVLAGAREPGGWWGPPRRADHGDAVEAARVVAQTAGVDLDVRADVHAPWHPGRCARLALAGGTLVGHAGELHPTVTAALGLPERTCAFELGLDVLLAADPGPVRAAPVSTFPLAKEDVALVVASDVPAADVQQALVDGGGELLEDVRLFDVYTGEQVGEGRTSLAFALRLRAPDRTLTAQEANAVRDAAVAEASRRTGAVLRGA
jgi:phenylalanyl-tRNA synthetase beta chain